MSAHNQQSEAESSTSYRRPVKRITSKRQLEAFQRSATHHEILDFVTKLNEAVVGKRLSDAGQGNERTRPLLDILDEVLALSKATPPVDNNQSRFGNPAFRTLYDKIVKTSADLHHRIPSLSPDAITEVEVYFQESWGNQQRIDYGSGMELNFLSWMLCLRKLDVIQEDDYSFMVLGVFWRYLEVMRHIQSAYWLEPAGSHGVWGLDDYQFLPFLWGSGQLRDHKHLRPRAIRDPEVLDAFSHDYMYLSCILFINNIKSVSLRWHSPMLDDISAVKTWSKVNSGMLKMYDAEVLGKLPVMQHALFGSLLPFPTVDEDPSLADEDEEVVEHNGHVHRIGEEGWTMDCCGIAVPSAFAQAQAGVEKEPQKSMPFASSKPGLRAIPFD